MSGTGTPTDPVSTGTKQTEPKVKAATVATYLVGLVLAAVVSGVTDGNLVTLLPDWLASILAPILPAAAAWLAGYNAKHQYRTPETTATP